MTPDKGPGRGAVVITGASTGIGRACALLLDSMGYRVFAGVRKDKDAEALASKASVLLMPVMLDVTEPESLAAASKKVEEETGDAGIMGLVNNAGIAVAGPLEFLPLDLLRAQLEVNVLGQVAVTQAFLPLVRAGRGRIVNISSDNGKAAWPYLGAYCASKHAIEALADSLRMELKQWGIDVVLVEPGSIKTEIWGKSKGMADDLVERMPARGRELYGPAIPMLHKVADLMEETGIEAEAVAKAVVKALLTTRPKPRYVVGIDARLQMLASRILPTRLRDWLILQAIAYLGRQ